MSEGVTVGVCDGDELEEGEIDGAVGDRKRRELNGVDGDLGVLWLEDEEVDDGYSKGDEEQENGCYDA